MFSAGVIGLLVALSATAWVYNKAMRQTGGNGKTAATVAIIAGVISFIVILTLVNLVDASLD